MKNSVKYIIIILTAIWGCDEERPAQNAPVLSNMAASEITDVSARYSFSLSPVGATQKAGLIYGTEQSLSSGSQEAASSDFSGGTVTLQLSGLSSGVTYYCKAFAADKTGSFVYSEIREFQTTLTPYLNLSTTTVSAQRQAGNYTFSIGSNAPWTVTSGQSWCSVQPASGSGDGTVTAAVTENSATTSRTATLTVTAGSQTKQVSVVQAALYLNLSTATLSAQSQAGNYTFSISANAPWTVTSGQSWCSVQPASGSGDGTVTVAVTGNSATSSRTATLTVTAGSQTKQVSVQQAGTGSSGSDFTETSGGVNFGMIFVQGGTFTMGCTGEQGSDCYSDEKPAHQVTLSSYYIGKYEVTQSLWLKVMGSFPGTISNSYGKGDNYPVYNVSWNDVQTFISKLNQMTGKQYRLLTEAEWEYAARGGTKSKGYKYSGSNTVGDVAWYSSNSSSTTHAVGTKQANELGIYDMSGNVWEWCSDWYGAYGSSSQTNPQGASSGSNRVDRGGGWSSDAQFCRVACRDGLSPGFRNNNLSFRVACSSK